MSRTCRLSQQDVRTFVQELETGRGGLAALAARKPCLTTESRLALSGTTRLFRMLSLRPGQRVRPERVVSTTTDPKVALRMAWSTLGLVFARGRAVELRKAVLRYDAPTERVVLHVPTLCRMAREQQGRFLGKVRVTTRRGERMSGKAVLDEVCPEDEVIADVRGLRPRRFGVPDDVDGRKRTVAAVVRGEWAGGAAHVQDLRRHHASFFVDQVAAARSFNRLAARTRGFFFGPPAGSEF